MAGDLLPCPFCGGTRPYVAFYNRPCVVCPDCDADGPGAMTMINATTDIREQCQAEAVKRWNTRTAIPVATPGVVPG